jgi:hypothetical protein
VRHLVEPRNPARVALDVFALGTVCRVEWKDGESFRRDRAREFPLVVGAAPVLVDFDRPASPFPVDRQPHDDHHVAHVVFDAERGELRVVARRLRQDDRREAEPPEAVHKLEEVIPEQVLRRPRTEERRRRIEDDGSCTRLLHQVLDPMHEAEEVVVAADHGGFLEGTHHFRHVNPSVGKQAAQVEAQRVTGGEQVVGGLLDAQNDDFDAVAGEVRRRLKPEDGLPGAAPADDQRRSADGNASVREHVEAGDAGLHFRHHGHRLSVTPQDFSRSTSGSAFERSPTT